jgi:hypothetical protein
MSQNPRVAFILSEEIFNMIRKILMLCAVTAPCLFAQQPPSPKAQTPVTPQQQMPIQPPKPVAPESTVITIHGLCPTAAPPIGHKSDSCTVLLTRAELETMLAAINLTNQNYPPAAMRSMASNYITVMALADA